MKIFACSFICLKIAVCAVFCQVAFLTGCSTMRTIHVVDANGLPVPNGLVVFRENNISPFNNKTKAGFADLNGEYKFEAKNLVSVEAFDTTSSWGKLNLKDNLTGTVVLTSMPYEGFVIGWYLARTRMVPEEIRSRLETFRSKDKD